MPHNSLEYIGRPLKKSIVGGNLDYNTSRRPGAKI
jgi:hypothetical protein